MTKDISKCFIGYANRIAETVYYKSWSDHFCREEIARATMDFASELRKHVDFKHLAKEDAEMLCFAKWEEDLYLIPFYFLPIIPVGTQLTSILGETIIYDGHNIDLDTRGGFLAWGIKIKE